MVAYLEQVSAVNLFEKYRHGNPSGSACLEHTVEELLVEVTVEGSSLLQQRHFVGIDFVGNCFVDIKSLVGEGYAVAIMEVAGGINLDIVGCLSYYLTDIFSG